MSTAYQEQCDIADEYLQRTQRNLFEAIPFRLAHYHHSALRTAYIDLAEIRAKLQQIRDDIQKSRGTS
jgi:hypothetical protein